MQQVQYYNKMCITVKVKMLGSELNGNLDIYLFCLYLLNNAIKIASQNHKMDL